MQACGIKACAMLCPSSFPGTPVGAMCGRVRATSLALAAFDPSVGRSRRRLTAGQPYLPSSGSPVSARCVSSPHPGLTLRWDLKTEVTLIVLQLPQPERISNYAIAQSTPVPPARRCRLLPVEQAPDPCGSCRPNAAPWHGVRKAEAHRRPAMKRIPVTFNLPTVTLERLDAAVRTGRRVLDPVLAEMDRNEVLRLALPSQDG